MWHCLASVAGTLVSAIIKYGIIYCTDQLILISTQVCNVTVVVYLSTPHVSHSCIPLHWLTHETSVLCNGNSCICVCLCSVVQEACADVWPAKGHATINHFDIKHSEDQSFDGYDTIKLEVNNISKVSSHVAQPTACIVCARWDAQCSENVY